MLHLDHDRKGVPGSPDLAPTILKKIEQSAVFIADVTLVGRPLAGAPGGKRVHEKRFINSNVGIEYGYALHALTDAAIQMVQNTHYGDRDKLPFDLQHKAGPIQYRLAPTASNAEIAAARVQLVGSLITALRPYFSSGPARAPSFRETPATRSPAFFFDTGEVFARIGEPSVDEIALQFKEPRAFYLRLIPAVDPQFKIAELGGRLQSKVIDTLSPTLGGMPQRNRDGIVSCNPRSGASNALGSFSQVFRNGEFWSVTSGFYAEYQGRTVVPTGSVENICKRVLANFVTLAEDAFGLTGPFTVEIGATGLGNTWLGTGHRAMIGPIHDEQVIVRRVLNGTSLAAQAQVIGEFIDELYDRAGGERAA